MKKSLPSFEYISPKIYSKKVGNNLFFSLIDANANDILLASCVCGSGTCQDCGTTCWCAPPCDCI